MSEKKTVLIVDDHPLFREGLKSLLTGHSGLEVIGEAGTGREALLKAEALRPDLVVMDLSLPDQSGIDVTRSLRELLPETRIMMLSMHSKIDYITEAFQAGATGYVVKESASERLIECLETVSRGEYFIDASLSHQVAKNLMESGEKSARITDVGYSMLTSREQQVMRLIAEGIPTKKVAKKLFISPKTVENHRTNIMNKLDLHSTMELVRYAARLGLIDVDLWKG
ncbi:MAG: response regulator transcription factor [Deltaproteobacteria bacterium]|nr:response regulator transcription factor [Deltaproteobacteria bacterium]